VGIILQFIHVIQFNSCNKNNTGKKKTARLKAAFSKPKLKLIIFLCLYPSSFCLCRVSSCACDACGDACDAFAAEAMQKMKQQKIMQLLKEEIFFS